MRKADKRQDVPPYIVPLSVQAIEIVRYLLGVMRPAQIHLLTHRPNFKRISENTLNAARSGWATRINWPVGIRGTISTALNGIGYPKIWVDAQLHSDPNKVSSAYNHAQVRRAAPPDDAELGRSPRLARTGARSKRAVPTSPSISRAYQPSLGRNNPDDIAAASSATPVPPVVASPIVVTPNDAGITFQRLSQVPPPPTHAPKPEVSAIQREREETGHLRIAETVCRCPCSANWRKSPRTRSTAS